jgi:hypothetical protein
MKNIFTILVLSLLLISCKKYQEDSFYSTYTATSRLTELGGWQITEVSDLQYGQINQTPSSFNLNFDGKRFSTNGKCGINNSNVFLNNLAEYWSELKPAFSDLMDNPSDIIIISNGEVSLPYFGGFEFKNSKKNLVITNFISFCYLIGSDAYLRQSIDVEFKIEKLELGEMWLNYQDKLRLKFKKIPDQ